MLRLSSDTNNIAELPRKGSFVELQTLKPKPIIQIISRPNIYNSISIQFPSAHSEILAGNSTTHASKVKPSLNAIKATKIGINPLLVSHTSSVIQVSAHSQPFNAKDKLHGDRPLNPAKRSEQPPEALFNSVAESMTERGICSVNNISDYETDQSNCKSSFINELTSFPLFHKSDVSNV